MNTLLAEGLNLMLLGMGAVFVFLTVLVFTTTFMSRIIGKYAPTRPAVAKASTPQPVAVNDDKQLMAVITAAIHQHRSRK
ncbi:MAG: OadG family protein [Pseudomonadales bacterium]|nr:OadG family protein [Pseudomonadales bacterium]